MKAFGSEQFLLEKNPLLRFFGTLLGELHLGTRVRFLYLNQILQEIKIDSKEKISILDAGCGKGQNTFYLAQKIPGSALYGIDINSGLLQDRRRLAELKSLNNRIHFINADLENMKFKKSFALILCFDVLEHIQDYEKTLKNLTNHLQPGGIMIIHVPQAGKYMNADFGLRRCFPQDLEVHSDRHDDIPGEKHLHEGLSRDNFLFLKQLAVTYEIKDTFNRWIMFLHTIFEAYRGKPRYWHLLLTPALTLLCGFKLRTEFGNGGGLLLIIRKSNTNNEKLNLK